MIDLPIQLIPNTDPPRFRWYNRVNVLGGYTLQRCEGTIDPSIEVAVKELISMCLFLKDKVIAQDDLLKKRAEVTIPVSVTPKKGK